MPEQRPPYPVTGVHCRVAEGTTTYSVHSPDPQLIIGWLAAFIEGHTSFSVLFDHDFGERHDA